jgi:hypothetical protein
MTLLEQLETWKMSKLMINDLPASAELDRAAVKHIVGGLSLGWIQPFIKQQTGGNFGGTTFNFFDIDYNVFQQNPTNININNLGGDGSAMVNEIMVMPINAASPANLVNGA